jgi:cytochrome c nitrite reductase small subunit
MKLNPFSSLRGKAWRKDFALIVIGVAVLSGIVGGVGSYTFIYAKGFSYMTNDPGACANCHIMNDHYRAWSRSSHHAVAVCNDCHTPHDLTGKYTTKAINGFNHSLAFTTGWYEENLIITERNTRVTENSCRHCHERIAESIDHGSRQGVRLKSEDRLSCIRCHSEVGHLE